MLSCYHSTPYFWERVLFLKRRFIVCYFQFEISVLKCCSLFQFIRVIWFVWQDVAYSEWDMLGKWHIGDVGCWGCKMFRMWMFRMWDVRDVGCSGCGMFGMWDVQDMGCSGCGMFEMWDVHDVGCWFKKCLSVVVCICKIHAFNGVIASQIIPNFWNRSPDRMDVFETFTGGRYHRDMKILKILTSKCKHFRFYAIF